MKHKEKLNTDEKQKQEILDGRRSCRRQTISNSTIILKEKIKKTLAVFRYEFCSYKWPITRIRIKTME